jgi:hypothetical protein
MVDKVVISRHWNNPQISYSIAPEGINVQTKLDDYLVAMVEEIGNPAILLVMTKNRLLQLLRDKSTVVCEKIKQATAQGN